VKLPIYTQIHRHTHRERETETETETERDQMVFSVQVDLWLDSADELLDGNIWYAAGPNTQTLHD